MKRKDQELVAIGKRIRELRKSKGFSQEGFAHAAGIARTYMGHIERGEQNISVKVLLKIARTLNMGVEEIVLHIRDLERDD